MRIHIIMHEAFESPGAIASWINKNKYTSTYSRVYKGDTLPLNANGFDMLLVMGGPQSPYTSIEECAHFDTKAEQKLIKEAVDNEKIVLGICLGAQLISNALGGKTVSSPHKEIGLFPVSLTEQGQNDELFAHFPPSFKCGHWHGDMPGLTDNAVIIAKSEGCPRQIIKFAPKAYAFQCHLEFNDVAINDMILNCHSELEKEKTKPFVETAEQLKANDYGHSNELLFGFLDKLVLLT